MSGLWKGFIHVALVCGLDATYVFFRTRYPAYALHSKSLLDCEVSRSSSARSAGAGPGLLHAPTPSRARQKWSVARVGGALHVALDAVGIMKMMRPDCLLSMAGCSVA